MEAWLVSTRTKLRPYLAPVDKLSDKFTSYRLVLYFLYSLTAWATLLALFGQGPFRWYEILLSAGWLILVCRVANRLLARRFNVAVNNESDLITALILALIMSPPSSPKQWLFLTLAAATAMASKYLIVIGRKHLFNPAAFGAGIAGVLLGYSPSWWIGMEAVMPLLLVGGFLLVRKMGRLDMVGLFLAIYLVLTFFQLFLDAPLATALEGVWSGLSASSLLFFAAIMLTEPLTSPRQRSLYLSYGALVAALYSLTGLDIRPEHALLLGNAAAFIADPNPRRSLKFMHRHKEADGIESFVFEGKKGLNFNAGQYLEWTLPQHKSDSRGNRRYLTVSSSPSESRVMFTIKLPERMSSFKAGLQKLHPGDKILAGQLSGRFILPHSEKTKMVWLAGGIGITPFRSMAKYMTDFEQTRDVNLVYFAVSPDEFAFKDVFNEAEPYGLKTIYGVTGRDIPKSWDGHTGGLNKRMLISVIPDYTERLFYISGPYGFVTSSEQALLDLGISPKQIITDYFPGYG